VKGEILVQMVILDILDALEILDPKETLVILE
jgi:SpoU rRNA methylase family enzyme